MKICFVIHGLSMGGAEKFLINMANYFKKIGHHCDIILLSNDADLTNEVEKGINIFKVIRNSRYDATVFGRLRRQIKNNGYNTIFCINSYSYFYVRVAFLFQNNLKFILSPHTTKPFSFYKYLQNLIYYSLLREADRIIYLCENQRQYLKNIYKYKHTKEDIVYNGINTEYFDCSLFEEAIKVKKRKDLGISESDKVIVQVARISPEKNQVAAIKSLKILHKKYNIKAHLILVGWGKENLIDELNQEIMNHEINQYVHMVGNQSDVRPFYYMSDMFSLTSKSETFPISALEAMSFGLPCVLTNVGGVEEIIKIKENGRIAKEGDQESIAREWNSVLTESIDKNKIRIFLKNNFSSERMFNRYKNIIVDENISETHLE